MPIQLLPELVVSQIAAGEVVERPASAVKELVENALDAGAAHIFIEVNEGGRRLIRVSDDGTGIPTNEVTLAVARHATSKLTSASDLATMQTLGFRGEALASIVAVSHTTLVTRHRSEQTGMELRLEGGQLRHQKAIGVPAGTVITVENLFYNTPARLKFLKSEANEKRHIQNIICDYAMAYTNVRFVLAFDGREVFRSLGGGNLDDVVVKVFGLDVFKQMVEVMGGEHLDNDHALELHGYISLPDMHRNDRSRIAIFVNGRSVQDNNLVYAITQAYHLLMERGRYPYAILMLRCSPSFVDVNVHPTKAEVRFADPNLVFVAVQRAVRDVLLRRTRYIGTMPSEQRREPLDISTNLPSQNILDIEVEDAVPTSRPQRMEQTEDDEFAYIPDGSERPAKPRTLPPLRAMGQLSASYIVAEGPAGLYLVDQFAASERVLYESLLEEHGKLHESTHTLTATTLELTAAQMRLMGQHQDALGALGIVYDVFGNNSLILRQVPQLVAPRDALELLRQLVIGLSEGDSVPQGVLLRLAQIAAYKTGQKLTTEQMEGLLRRLERCPQPLRSPSDKATLIHMSSDQLAKEFTRRG